MPPDGDVLSRIVSTDGAGSRLSILVSSRSSRDGVGPVEGDRLRVRVTAAPVDNAANKAVIRLLSDRLTVPRSSIEIESGESSKRKMVGFTLPVEDLKARLAGLLAEQDDSG